MTIWKPDIYDNAGFWWNEEKASRKKSSRPTVSVPSMFRMHQWGETDYTPAPLPENLSGPVGIDFETEDTLLHTKGASWAFKGVGKILGMSIAYHTNDGIRSDYYATNHETENCSYDIQPWLAAQYKNPNITWIGSNTQYDLGWAYRDLTQCYPNGRVVDTQHMGALLDEYRYAYGLESLAQDYLGVGKEKSIIDLLRKGYRLTLAEVMDHLKYIPGANLAAYGATDALRALQVYEALLPKLQEEGLEPVFDLECSLIPMCTEMRRRGIRIDLERAHQARNELATEQKQIQDRVLTQTGVAVEPWNGAACAKALETQGIKIGKTKDGSPKVDVELLSRHSANPIAASISRMRKISKVVTTFLDGHFIGHEFNGRLHPTINQLKSEREQEEDSQVGTVTGRFSITDPGLQQIPVRDPEWGTLLRGLVLPEEDYEYVASADIHTQEPVLAIHFAAKANLRGAWRAVEEYRKDPRKTDPHQVVANLCSIIRNQAKTLFLGRSYGQGGAKTARKLGLPTKWMVIGNPWIEIDASEVAMYKSQGNTVVECAGEEASVLIKKMNDKVPYIKAIFDECQKVAKERGYILTLMRRRCRFPAGMPLHKALNRLCQGSAAEQMKSAMWDLWRAGIVPFLTIHDELLFSVNSKEEAEPYAQIMENTVELLVPSVCDVKIGRTWGAIPK